MKKILKVFSVILAVFLVFNIIWALMVFPKYKDYKNAVGYDEQRERWYCREDDYIYSVSSPDYLSFTGNLSVSEVMKMKKDGTIENKTNCSIIIWPELNGEYKFGANIGIRNDDNSITSYKYYIDEKIQPVNELVGEDKNIFEDNRAYIVELCRLAKEKWNDLPIVIDQE